MSELPGAFTIRPVAPGDVDGVLALVHELARYEREPDAVEMTADQLHDALFAADAKLFGHVATATNGAGDVIAMALWFCNFSTWRGSHGVYLEDLFVHPEHRRRGVGEALLATLAKVCVDRGYTRLEWSVLDWNEPAIHFYRSLGAVGLHEWTVFRLDGEALAALATRTAEPRSTWRGTAAGRTFKLSAFRRGGRRGRRRPGSRPPRATPAQCAPNRTLLRSAANDIEPAVEPFPARFARREEFFRAGVVSSA
jgi:GNAT superfamily N-acetyltransferase